jgi:hypothetical protein
MTRVRSPHRSLKGRRSKKEQKNHPPPTPQGEPQLQLTLLFMQFVGLPKFFESHRREIVLAWSPEVRSRMDRGLLVLRLFVSSGVPIPYFVTERGERWRQCRCPELQGYSVCLVWEVVSKFCQGGIGGEVLSVVCSSVWTMQPLFVAWSDGLVGWF